MELFGKIRHLLSLTFDYITSDSSLIKHLNQLITYVGVMEPYLNHAQLTSYLALRFFMMLYNNNISLVDQALLQLNRCEQELYVFNDSMSKGETNIETEADPTRSNLKHNLDKAIERYDFLRKKREETA